MRRAGVRSLVGLVTVAAVVPPGAVLGVAVSPASAAQPVSARPTFTG